jgi:hypothetical protein
MMRSGPMVRFWPACGATRAQREWSTGDRIAARVNGMIEILNRAERLNVQPRCRREP